MSPSPQAVSLESLHTYAEKQQERIAKILGRNEENQYFKPTVPLFRELHSSAWGNDIGSLDESESVDKGPGPIDDSLLLPSVRPSDRRVMRKLEHLDSFWYFRCSSFLIRSEYVEAEKFVLDMFGVGQSVDGVVICGQPGIGKSVSLLRILLRRLALKLPTVLQIRSSCALLFHEGGVEGFSHLDGKLTYAELGSGLDHLGRIWALVDANETLPAPAPMFRNGPFFVVQAASPRPSRKDWTTGIRIRFFYMKLWAFTEVLQVSSLISPTLSEEQLWHLHVTYGASPRDLFVYAGNPLVYQEVVRNQITTRSPDQFRKLLTSTDDCPDNSHYLISTGPSPTDRTTPERKVISKHVLEECCREILKDDVEWLRILYEALHSEKSFATSAGMIFEHRLHQYLREGRILELFPLLANPSPANGNYVFNDYIDAGRYAAPITLPRMDKYLVDKMTERTHDLSTYFQPRSTNFTSIDSWVVIRRTPDGRPFLFPFQMTINERHHELKKEGLDRLKELAPDGAQMCPVIVTPKGVKPRITVPTTYLTREFLNGQEVNIAFPVSYVQIDPAELFKPL